MPVKRSLWGKVCLVKGSFNIFQYVVLSNPLIMSTNSGLVEKRVEAKDTGPNANAASMSTIANGAVTNSTNTNRYKPVLFE